jgi:hypothetical protein
MTQKFVESLTHLFNLEISSLMYSSPFGFYFISFFKERNTILKMIKSKRLISLVKTDRTIEEATNMWKEGKMSNYEYLMQLNKYSGRTFNDLMQYPIYPHVLANYSSQTLDLSRKENYRFVQFTI